ncbi:MAG: DUF4886 domain-containing protein, partial [Clostridia bacterium]|nr:DUF4886 domain-containing protein [Clostridia bacterium]
MKRMIPVCALFLALIALLTSCGQSISELTQTETAVKEKEAMTETNEKNIYQTSDPAEDGELNLLMIGSSFCYYYVEELHGMLKAAGIRANVCNVYYSGCPLEKHWTWWKMREAHYQYFITNDGGRTKTADRSLEWCLQQKNWD